MPVWYKVVQARPSPQSGVWRKLIRNVVAHDTSVEIRRGRAPRFWKHFWSLGVDGCGWRELKVLPVSWFDDLARILSKVDQTGVWQEGLLDAFVAMTDGDAAPLGPASSECFLPCGVSYLGFCKNGAVRGLVSVLGPGLFFFNAGGCRSSVEAWYTAALDTEEVLTSVVDSDIHLFVADVIESVDTVDGASLDRVLSSLRLPAWFPHAYF